MTFKELSLRIKIPIFTQNDVAKVFSSEKPAHINTQLHRFIKRGEIISLKRGLYTFPTATIDEFALATKIYTPSYVSLESALNAFGIIPDIPFTVTSISPITTKQIQNSFGNFLYSKIKKELFFGYTKVKDAQSGIYYNMAEPEKALLDYIYIRKITNLEEARVDVADLDKKKLKSFATHFPEWVGKVLNNA